MHTPLRSITLIAVLLAGGCATTPAPVSTGESYSWIDNPDYAKLRHDIGWSDDFHSRCEAERPLPAIYEAMNGKQWDKTAELGLEWLHQCPVDIRIHYYVALALRELAEPVHAQDHLRWTRGLMDSIAASGDGMSCETAYVTISVAEEYDALFLFGLKRREQALIGHCDLITAVDDKGEEVSIYFRPEAHFARLSKMLK